MMMSGRPGITRKTLVRADSASLLPPETYPAVTPTTTAMNVAKMPARKPTTMTPRVPMMIWLRMSWPMWVVPSRCAEGRRLVAVEQVDRVRVVGRDPRSEDREEGEHPEDDEPGHRLRVAEHREALAQGLPADHDGDGIRDAGRCHTHAVS